MSQYLQRESDKLKKKLLSLGAMVEERVRQAVFSLENRNPGDADRIIEKDYEIDIAEVALEGDCLRVLALYQPVAVDLRFLVAIIKINNDLERIADEAVNIARRIKRVIQSPDTSSPVFELSYREMGQKAESLLRQSLDALVNLDTETAFAVCINDSELDAMKEALYHEISEALNQHPEQAEPLINYYLISRHLERIGDHATNIAEEVIYLVQGEIIRHNDLDSRELEDISPFIPQPATPASA